MSLKNILLDVTSAIGLKTSNADERTWAVEKINEAALDLYTNDDLVGSLREQVFDIDDTEAQITLPYYVGDIRAVRKYDSARLLTLNDMRPRYQTIGWNSVGCLKWRIKHTSALGRSLENAAPLTVTIPFVEAFDFVVVVTGTTSTSARISETLTFPIGTLTKTTVSSFTPLGYNVTPIESIRKDKLTTYDITITDPNGVVLAILPNSELASRYTLVHIYDHINPSCGDDCNCVEILYKLRFTPLRNDYDEFPCERYDKAIFWKFMEHYSGTVEEKLAANAKCKEVIFNRGKEAEGGIQLKLDFGRNRFLGLTDFSNENGSNGPYIPCNTIET